MHITRRYEGDVRSIEYRVWGMEYRGQQHRGKDCINLCVAPLLENKVVLNFEGDKQEDTRRLYCQGGE